MARRIGKKYVTEHLDITSGNKTYKGHIEYGNRIYKGNKEWKKV